MTQQLGWRWIFWILAISSGVCLILILVYLPETSRYIVDNGSRETSGIRRALISYLQPLKTSPLPDSTTSEDSATSNPPGIEPPGKYHIPNPLASLKLLWAKDTALITTIYGVYYMVFSCLQASLSPLFVDIYRLSELNAGLIYLPFGVGSVVGAYCSGIPFPHFPHCKSPQDSPYPLSL